MKILWLPHMPSTKGFKGRHDFFIERLRNHNEIHLVEWETFGSRRLREFLSPMTYISAFKYWVEKRDGVMVHHIPRVYDPMRKLIPQKATPLWINQKLLHYQIRKLIQKYKVDVLICAQSAYLVGFPPFTLHIPIVFDYLDCADWSIESRWKDIEITYIKNSMAVLAVSNIGYKHAKLYNENIYYLPNGVDVIRFTKANGKRVREKLALVNKRVISLIGISCCPSLYFIDAVGMLAMQRNDIKCLIVGDSSLMSKIRAKIAKYPDTFILTGAIDYSEIPEYFAASDIGLYPQYDDPYFHSASPIKIFEYTAAGKWVVVSPCLDEVKRWGFPNIVFSEPNPLALKDTLSSYIDREPPKVPEYIYQFDWSLLVAGLENILNRLI